MRARTGADAAVATAAVASISLTDPTVPSPLAASSTVRGGGATQAETPAVETPSPIPSKSSESYFSSTRSQSPSSDAAQAFHPLQYTWTMYHDSKAKFPTPTSPDGADGHEYAAGLSTVGEFETVENFCRYFNWLKPPSQLETGSNYHLFKKGIKPMWEDAANANVCDPCLSEDVKDV